MTMQDRETEGPVSAGRLVLAQTEKLETIAKELVSRSEAKLNGLMREMPDKAPVEDVQVSMPPYFADLRSTLNSIECALRDLEDILDAVDF